MLNNFRIESWHAIFECKIVTLNKAKRDTIASLGIRTDHGS